ncbi:MAG: membrane protein insertion efficiency factor YidD [Clostridia bacterium]|nr:membrane protein insertion efficiency factor YidD [Clostridia bacterium]
MKYIIKGLIRFYQIFLSPLSHGCCRFYPTCSAYALEAVEIHGALKGSWLAFKRILRCNPLFPGGYDPVPPKTEDFGRNIKNRRK